MKEVSNIIALDRAFTRHITECDTQTGLTELKEFYSRPITERFFRGDNEDINVFIAQLNKDLAYQTVEKKQVKLPIVSLFRKLEFKVDSDDAKIQQVSLQTVPKAEEPVLGFKAERQNLIFTYSIVIAAKKRGHVHDLAVPLLTYLCRKDKFKMGFKLLKDETSGTHVNFNVLAEMKDPYNTTFDEVTPFKDTKKQIYAVQGNFEIKAPVLFLEGVIPEEYEYELQTIKSL